MNLIALLTDSKHPPLYLSLPMKTIVPSILSGDVPVTQMSATPSSTELVLPAPKALARKRNVNVVGALLLLSSLLTTLNFASRSFNMLDSDVSDVAMMAVVTGQMKDLPQLKERDPEPIDICFVSSIFGPTIKTADRPHDFTKFQMGNTTSFQFFMYTNLEDLESPGWTKVLRNFNYRRFITQSRWGKFMAWKDPEMKGCQTIFYFDGNLKPKKPNKSRKSFAELAKQIRESDVGFAQKIHAENPSAIGEFDKILTKKKDIEKNVNASIEWLQAQPDFYNNCTMYDNGFFGKSITSFFSFKRC
jgi:hypothetical protein